MDILVEKVSAQLRIKNPGCQYHENDDGYDRDNRNKQISDDEPVPQAPKQPASPPSHETYDKINGGDDRQELQEVEDPAVNAKKLDKQPQRNNRRAHNVQPRQAAPDLFQA